MTSLWSFDFGKVTGIALGIYGPSKPYELVQTWHVRGGLHGFMEWLSQDWTPPMIGDEVVYEKFTQSPGNDFLANIDGIPIEGALEFYCFQRYIIAHAQTRNQKQKAGMYDSILKENGLWQSADDVEWTDGRDANDCIIHALEYLKNMPHLPTLREYFKED